MMCTFQFLSRLQFAALLLLSVGCCSIQTASGFTVSSQTSRVSVVPVHSETTSRSSIISLARRPNVVILNSNDDNNSNQELYTRNVRLREEAESPFRRVRFFLYAMLGGGAATSLALSLARIAAAASGINSDLMQESLVNAGVDLGGILVLAVLFRRDADAQESRLKRATKGASLARLVVRMNRELLPRRSQDDKDDEEESAVKDDDDDEERNPSGFVSVTLADLRRDRGIEKRVAIAAGGERKIRQVLDDARSCADALERSDLIVVPVVLPLGTAPESSTESLPTSVALPVGTAAWRTVLEDEMRSARDQNVDIETDGFCVILKKNGRVGQRTKGIFLERMVGEVSERQELGMDVTNI